MTNKHANYKPLEAAAILTVSNGKITLTDCTDKNRSCELFIIEREDKDGYEVSKIYTNDIASRPLFDIEGFNMLNRGRMAHYIENLIDGRKNEIIVQW